jgi:hypothetical protein
MHKQHPLAWSSEATEYPTTHCKRCLAGWSRLAPDGSGVVVCLLDREPVLPNMIFCDRFEAREELEERDLMPKRSTG